MAFNGFFDNVGSGANFLPIVKYDARSGRISRRDRVNGETTEIDITKNFKAVFDAENVEIGWASFNTGGAPDMRLVRMSDGKNIQRPTIVEVDEKTGREVEKNDPNFRACVRYVIKLGKECGGDIREFATNANASLDGIKKLQDAYESGVKQNPGKLPVVEFKDSIAKTSGEGQKRSTNYAPVFEIVGWVKRPEDLVYQARSSSTEAVSSAPPSTGSTKVSAPTVSPTSDDEDFG